MSSADDFVVEVIRIYLRRGAEERLKDIWPGPKVPDVKFKV